MVSFIFISLMLALNKKRGWNDDLLIALQVEGWRNRSNFCTHPLGCFLVNWFCVLFWPHREPDKYCLCKCLPSSSCSLYLCWLFFQHGTCCFYTLTSFRSLMTPEFLQTAVDKMRIISKLSQFMPFLRCLY